MYSPPPLTGFETPSLLIPPLHPLFKRWSFLLYSGTHFYPSFILITIFLCHFTVFIVIICRFIHVSIHLFTFLHHSEVCNVSFSLCHHFYMSSTLTSFLTHSLLRNARDKKMAVQKRSDFYIVFTKSFCTRK